jgi:hypothetical protein
LPNSRTPGAQPLRLRNGSKIQRYFRDLQAGNVHFMTGEQSFTSAGRHLAGLPDVTPGL